MPSFRMLSGLALAVAASTPASAQYYGYYAPYPYAYAPPIYAAPRAAYLPPVYAPYYVRPAPTPRVSYRPTVRRAPHPAPVHPAPVHPAAFPAACLPPPGGPILAPQPSAQPANAAPPAAAPALTPPREYYPPESFQQDRPRAD